jgi:hypothetical protein
MKPDEDGEKYVRSDENELVKVGEVCNSSLIIIDDYNDDDDVSGVPFIGRSRFGYGRGHKERQNPTLVVMSSVSTF